MPSVGACCTVRAPRTVRGVLTPPRHCMQPPPPRSRRRPCTQSPLPPHSLQRDGWQPCTQSSCSLSHQHLRTVPEFVTSCILSSCIAAQREGRLRSGLHRLQAATPLFNRSADGRPPFRHLRPSQSRRVGARTVVSSSHFNDFDQQEDIPYGTGPT